MPSRYDNNKIEFDFLERVNVIPIRQNIEYDVNQTLEIVLEAGDTYESLANRLYGSSTLWWILADLNSLTHPLFMRIGTRIKILYPQYVELFFRGIVR